jgi:hypothetical protein
MRIAKSKATRHCAIVGAVAAGAIAAMCSLACGSGGPAATQSDAGNGGPVEIPGGAGKTFVPEGIV